MFEKLEKIKPYSVFIKWYLIKASNRILPLLRKGWVLVDHFLFILVIMCHSGRFSAFIEIEMTSTISLTWYLPCNILFELLFYWYLNIRIYNHSSDVWNNKIPMLLVYSSFCVCFHCNIYITFYIAYTTVSLVWLAVNSSVTSVTI